MKKVLLLFALLVGSMSAMATEVITYDFTPSANADGWPSSVPTSADVIVSTSKSAPELTISFCHSYWGKSKENSYIALRKNTDPLSYIKIDPIKDKIITEITLFLPTNSSATSAFELFIEGNETSLGKITFSKANSNSNTIEIPTNLQSEDNVIILKNGTNGKNECRFGKLILTVEDAVKVEADHATITPESKEFTDNIDITLKAFDAQNAEVQGANIYYTLNGGVQQSCKSPYTLNLTESTAIEAWVEGQDPHATATFTLTIPEVQPGVPVFSVNGTELTDEEVILPYGSELTVTSENAVYLEVLEGEDSKEIQNNTYTTVITDDVDIIVTAYNGTLSSEALISVTMAAPALTVKAGEQEFENNGEYKFDQGTVIFVAAENAQKVIVLDSENNEIELVNNGFEPTKDDIYTVKAIAGSKVTEITFSVELTIPEYQNVTATYVFTTEGAYGMSIHSQSDEATKGTYEENVRSISNKEVTLSFNSKNGEYKYRLWKNNNESIELRINSGNSFNISVPVNCYITSVVIDGTTSFTSQPTNMTNDTKGTYSFDANDKVKFITFTAGTSTHKINTIAVNYVKDNYTATATVEVDKENPYEYAYGHANVLVFKPHILFNGNPIEDTEYANYEVRLNGVALGQADQTELLNYFAYDKENTFTLHKGEKTIGVEVKWPEIDVNPVISEVEYLKENDGRMHAVYYVMPENNPQGLHWNVVCEDAHMLYWNGKTGAACQFNEVGDQAENAPEAFDAHISYPFAVRKAAAASQTIKLMAEDDDIEINEYHAPAATLVTADVDKPNENNTSGVADVAVDEAGEVEFFNLQGVRVNGELTPGLYIRRQGNTAVKVVINN